MSAKDLTTATSGDGKVSATRKVETWLSPAVDIFENDSHLTLVADLPGVPKDRLNLDIDKGILAIEALAPVSSDDTGLYREFGTIGYSRRFQLPDALEYEQAEATMKDGVLTVRLPKSAKARPHRIDVSVH